MWHCIMVLSEHVRGIICCSVPHLKMEISIIRKQIDKLDFLRGITPTVSIGVGKVFVEDVITNKLLHPLHCLRDQIVKLLGLGQLSWVNCFKWQRFISSETQRLKETCIKLVSSTLTQCGSSSLGVDKATGKGVCGILKVRSSDHRCPPPQVDSR
jgi:hypothetical protein